MKELCSQRSDQSLPPGLVQENFLGELGPVSGLMGGAGLSEVDQSGKGILGGKNRLSANRNEQRL